jgi:hypothetical protein
VKRPILCIAPPDGDAAFIINSTGAGKVFGFTDVEGIKRQLILWYQDFKSGQLSVSSKGIELYSRKKLTGDLVNILNDLTA